MWKIPTVIYREHSGFSLASSRGCSRLCELTLYLADNMVIKCPFRLFREDGKLDNLARSYSPLPSSTKTIRQWETDFLCLEYLDSMSVLVAVKARTSRSSVDILAAGAVIWSLVRC